MLEAEKRAFQIRVDHTVPIALIQLREWCEGDGDPVGAHPGIVEGYIDASELSHDAGHHRFDLCLIGDVALNADSLPVQVPDLPDGLFCRAHAVARHHGHLGAFAGKGKRRRPTDARGTTCHNGNFPADSRGHLSHPYRRVLQTSLL